MALETEIKSLASRIGYVACGICSAEPFDQFALALRDHIAHAPEHERLYQDLAWRTNPQQRSTWAHSIVVCVRWYGRYAVDQSPPGIGRNYLFDRRHADCPDHGYPKAMRTGLRALGMRVAQGGVSERWAAVRSGVAKFGRNCCVYADDYGSWVNIESFVVDAPLEPDAPSLDLACPDSCRACIDACPTGALDGPLNVRMERCVAYLTYDAPEPLDPALESHMGPWLYGCDQCQLVCPLNKAARAPQEKARWIEPTVPLLSAEALAVMDEGTLRTLIHPRFTYIGLEDVGRWNRNARRALSHRATAPIAGRAEDGAQASPAP